MELLNRIRADLEDQLARLEVQRAALTRILAITVEEVRAASTGAPAAAPATAAADPPPTAPEPAGPARHTDPFVGTFFALGQRPTACMTVLLEHGAPQSSAQIKRLILDLLDVTDPAAKEIIRKSVNEAMSAKNHQGMVEKVAEGRWAPTAAGSAHPRVALPRPLR